MQSSICKKIAQTAVKIGVNLQPGQDAVVFCSISQAKLAEAIVEECYKRGARKVVVEWFNDKISKLDYLYQNGTTLNTIEDWEVAKIKRRSEILPALIYVEDSDPDAFDGCDMEKIAASRIARRKAIKEYRDKENLYNQWTIIAVPSPAWAQKVFPNFSKARAQEALLDAIMKTMRIDVKDPVKSWEKHIAYLKEKAQKLNSLDLDYLEYKSKNGTDLTIKLQPNHVWLSARSKSLQNIEYCANMPTEEIFTMPKRDGVNGIVKATKPLSYNGKVIEDFEVQFKDGRIVSTKARVNGDVLQKAIETDEGSHYLGEVALVPFDSPVNQTGILFYNTLFDENACCHLAFGQAFEDNIKGYENMTKEDLLKIGFNDSLIHVDFMIGSQDLSIVGYDKKGNFHQIFKHGCWSI